MHATVNGVSIYCTSLGRGIPCLVPSLAGTPIYERTFSSPALLAHLQLVFAELRANRTPVGDLDALTLESLIADMDGLRRALGFERIAVLGHSGHSILAFAYAARYPQHVLGVISVGGLPEFSTEVGAHRERYWNLLASAERKRLHAEKQAALTDAVLGRLTPSERIIVPYIANGPRTCFDPTYDCTPLWRGHDNLSAELYTRFWGQGGQFSTFSAEESFPRIGCPVCIAQGVFDFGCPPLVWSGVRNKLSDVTYQAFERSGHYPQMEEREKFDTALLAWLERS